MQQVARYARTHELRIVGLIIRATSCTLRMKS